MLNEMNPKLKALLAAGLIGTAGLGMQSCSNPSDPVYYPYTVDTTTTYTVDTPSTNNPGSGGGTENPGNGGGAENPNPSGGEENGGNGGETVEENEVTFEKLGVKNPNDQEIIAYTTAVESAELNVRNLKDLAAALKEAAIPGHVYLYLVKGTKKGFQDVSEMEYSESAMNLIGYARNDNYYYIPESMKESFDKAIAAYKASHN